MPDREIIEILLRAKDEASKQLRTIDKGLLGMGKSVKTIGRQMMSLKRIAIATFVGWGVLRVVKELEQLSKTQEQAEATTVQAMVSMGRYSANFEKTIFDTATALQRMTTFGDEAILTGTKFLLTYKDIGDNILPRTMSAMTDVAALMGGDMRQAANMLGKASMGMIGELRRVGITVDKTTYESEGFLGVLREIEKQVKGQAKALANTRSGGLEQFGNVADDVKEKFGFLSTSIKFYIAKQVIPELIKLDDYFGKIKESGQLDDWAKTAAKGFLDAVDVMISAVEALGKAILGIRAGFGVVVEKFYGMRREQVEAEQKRLEEALNPDAMWRILQPKGMEQKMDAANRKRLEEVKALADEYTILERAGKDMAEGNIKNMDEIAAIMDKAREKVAGFKQGIDETTAATEKLGKSQEDLKDIHPHEGMLDELDEYIARLERWEQLMEQYGYVTLVDPKSAEASDIIKENLKDGVISTEELFSNFEGIPPKWEKTTDEMQKIGDTFLEQTQIAFADIFSNVFDDTVHGWASTLDIMGGMFKSLGSQLTSKGFMEFGKSLFSEGPLAGGTNIMLGAALGGVSTILSGAFGGKKDRYKQELEMYERKRLELWKTIRAETDKLTESYNDSEKALLGINKSYDDYKRALIEANGSISDLTELEKLRVAALAATAEKLRVEFAKPLEDMIASMTMPDYEYDLYKQKVWFDSIAGSARVLGEESITLLREAYELSKQQYALRVQEALATSLEEYREILTTMDMSPIESQIHAIESHHQAAIASWSDSEQELTTLGQAIQNNVSEMAALQEEYSSLQETYAAAEQGFASAWDKLFAEYKKYGYTYEEVWHKLELELAGMSTSNVEPFETLMANTVAAFRHLEELQITALPVIEALPAEMVALSSATAELEVLFQELSATLGETVAAELEAYMAQREALAAKVASDWRDIIRQYTMSQQELDQFALDEWYAEQLLAAEALGLALDDLNLAYDLQKEAIWETENAVEDLTSELERAVKSIDDMLAELTGGKLAPVQSMEYYQSRYQQLLTAGDVDEVLSYIPEYLDFMKAFGSDYAQLTASITADLETLRAQLENVPGAQHGALLRVGEKGSELLGIFPTYEPERSAFLRQIGADPDTLSSKISDKLSAKVFGAGIGEEIASSLAPLLSSIGGGNVNVQVNVPIGDKEIAYSVTKSIDSRNPELVGALRRIV